MNKNENNLDIVKNWLVTNTYDYSKFSDLKEIETKLILKNLKISVIIPTLEEESTIEYILNKSSASHKVYVCGPGKMIQSTVKIGIKLGWNESNIHFEYFKNENKINNSSHFKIELARSALSLDVPPGKSILQVLNDNGVNLVSSCEQGACGTCKVRVIEGDIEHQDVFLNSLEKTKGNVILTCVSRAKSKRLVLDI